MKKKKKKLNLRIKKNLLKKGFKKKKKNTKKRSKKKNKIRKSKIKNLISKKSGLILNFIRFQENIKKKFKFRININFLFDRSSYSRFFSKIDNQFENYKILKAEEKRE